MEGARRRCHAGAERRECGRRDDARGLFRNTSGQAPSWGPSAGPRIDAVDADPRGCELMGPDGRIGVDRLHRKGVGVGELRRMRFAPRARGREVLREEQRLERFDVLSPADARGRSDRTDRAALDHVRGHGLGEVAQAAEVHEHDVEVGRRARQSRAVEQRVDDLADAVDRGVDLIGVAQVALGVARETCDVGLLDVDRMHLDTEVDEDRRGRRAHARGRAGHDDPFAFVTEDVTHGSRVAHLRRLRPPLGAGPAAMDVAQAPDLGGVVQLFDDHAADQVLDAAMLAEHGRDHAGEVGVGDRPSARRAKAACAAAKPRDRAAPRRPGPRSRAADS